jgi:iron complex transport system substrate-binding protein
MRRLVTSQRHRMTTRPGIYALEPHSLGDILSDIKTVGDATGRQVQARALIESLRARIDAVSLRAAECLAEQPPRRVACVQRSEPPIAVGWWLAELIGLAGGLDVLDGVGRPPRPVTREQIRAAQPDLVIDLAPDEVVPGPQTVDVLERMLAQILHNTVGLRSEIGS